MSKIKTSRYDVTEHLRNPEEMAAYLDACLEDPERIKVELNCEE
jgi:DNA-binding phage protein